MKPKLSEDIRRRLTLREVPKPPDDLAHRIKKDIPPHFKYRSGDAKSRGRKSENLLGGYWGLSWQLAASVLVVVGLSYGIFTVSKRQEAAPASMVAESAPMRQVAAAPPPARTDISPMAATEGGVEQQEGGISNLQGHAGVVTKGKPSPAQASATSSVASADASAYVPLTPPPRPLPDQPPASVREKKDSPAEVAIAESARAEETAAGSALGGFAPEPGDAGKQMTKTAAPAPPAAAAPAVAMRAQAADDKAQASKPAAIPVEPFKPIRITGANENAHGTVVIEASIDASGLVTAARVVQSVSTTADREAMNAVKGARFRAAVKDGRAVATVQRVEIQVEFVK